MRNNKPKVSIIVPVYNVESYLNRCLDSLINQSFDDIEIICINDGSTDSSLEILKEYEKKDSRVKIINQENQGLSGARNSGIEIAIGDYISFVDSDDWINLDMIKEMYQQANIENADVVICSYTREYSDKSRDKKFNMPEITIYNERDVSLKLHRKIVGPIREELANPDHTDSLVTAWGKLYKSSIIKENYIKFIDTKEIGTEDCLFNVYLFKHIKKAVFINKSYYHYWKENSNSLTATHKANLKDKWINMYNYIKEFLDVNKYEPIFYEALNNRICMSTLGLGLNECNRANKISEINKIKNMKSILEDKYISDAFRNLELKYFPRHWRIFYRFNKNKSAFASYCMLNVIEFLRTRI